MFLEEKKQKVGETIVINDINDSSVDEIIGEKAAATLRDELELIESVYPEFDREQYLTGEQQPVFLVLALNNFGVRELLDAFVEIAPMPQPKESDLRLVKPEEKILQDLSLKFTPIWIQNTVIDWLSWKLFRELLREMKTIF